MKAQLGVCMVVAAVAAVIGCRPAGGSATVPFVPIIWANAAARTIASPRTIVVDQAVSSSAEFQASFAPVVTGFQSNSSLQIGDSFESSGPANTSIITTTISSGAAGDVLFNGQFNDSIHPHGSGHYTLAYHPDSTFDFDQAVIYQWTFTTTTWTMLVMSTMSGTVAADGSYAGTGGAYAYQYIDDTSNPPATAEWTAFSGKMLSAGGFYGLLSVQATGPSGYVPYPASPVLPDYNSTTLINGLKSLAVSYPYRYLAYHDSTGWNMVTDPQATLLWQAHGGQ